MIDAMIIELRTSDDPGKIETIYFGGGTPSLLMAEEIRKLLDPIYKKFVMSPGTEVTLEVNPDDITPVKLLEWKTAGINRLSIGIQSFIEQDLQWMNRIHNAKQADDSIKMVKDCGFENFSVDLIYGIPGLTDDDWKRNIQKVIDHTVPHISVYALTVEPRTPLHKQIRQQKKENVDQEKQASQFLIAMEMLEDAGFEHYEISNLARPGYRSRHNSSYWKGDKYIGIGPSAHSYNNVSRRWNVSNNAVYVRSFQNNEKCYEEEILSEKQILNEYIMTSLRTSEGLEIDHVIKNFGKQAADKIISAAGRHFNNSLLKLSDSGIILTREGKLFADGIASDLFF